MKKLNKFLKFDFDEFIKDKNVIVKDIRPWFEYVDGRITDNQVGLRVDLLIIDDRTDYGDEHSSAANFGESFTVKIKDKFEVPVGFQDEVIVQGATATVYGRYQENLSVEAKNIVKRAG